MKLVVALLLPLLLLGCPASPDISLGDDTECTGEDCEVPADSCAPNRTVGSFAFCAVTTADSYVVVAAYKGAGTLDLAASEIQLNGSPADVASSFDSRTQTFTIRGEAVEPSKYSYLFRMKTTTGDDVRPLFVPMWIGEGDKYAGFTWHDAILYQIFTDRFFDGNPANNLNNAQGDLARVDDSRSRWQGGDIAGITAKLKAGYFESMGINTLWISSPMVNSHNSNPGVDPADTRRFASYHAYHPVVTGYTHLDHMGYAANPDDTTPYINGLYQLLTPGGIEAGLAEVAALAPEELTPQRLAECAARANLTLLPD